MVISKGRIVRLFISLIVVFTMFFIAKNYGLLRLKSFENLRKCQSSEKVKSEPILGIVIKKYRDTNNHNAKMVELQSNGDVLKTPFLIIEASGAFEMLNIGDFIRKEAGTLTLEVQRNDSIFNILLDYNCSN